ncbi:MAG: hypothetical protein ACUVTU_02920 [Desulfurispora sp.]|uniref:hypothetical protein n=1 Tax=Desulfurispora sp. TaxID=3014275 RepID=UPI00404A4ED0
MLKLSSEEVCSIVNAMNVAMGFYEITGRQKEYSLARQLFELVRYCDIYLDTGLVPTEKLGELLEKRQAMLRGNVVIEFPLPVDEDDSNELSARAKFAGVARKIGQLEKEKQN